MPFRKIDHMPGSDYSPLLIKTLIRSPLIYSPENEIIFRDKLRFNYKTLYRRISQLAETLAHLGVGPGDTVGVMDWDSHRYLECFFAVPMMGAVLHTINVRLSRKAMLYTINHAEDKVILVHADFLSVLSPIIDKINPATQIIVLEMDGDLPDFPLEIAGEYEELLARHHGGYEFPDFDEDAMATTFYTTGTTGTPKAVYFSHRQIVLHTYGLIPVLCAFDPYIQLNVTDVYMPLTPMYHVHGWGGPYLSTHLGLKQVYPGQYDVARIQALIQKEGVTFSHCIPTIMHMLIDASADKGVDLTRWKVIVGGSALSKELCRAAAAQGVRLIGAYGMSETCPLLTMSILKTHMRQWPEEDQMDIRCCAGLPVPLVNLEIVDMDGIPIPHDGQSVGEVVVKAPWLTQGYLKDPEKAETLWRDGWLHTDDIGFMDSEGYLHLTDRIGEVIKTGGEWVSTVEIEEILCGHDAVLEAAVVGIPDKKWGERPHAMVVLQPDSIGKVSETEIRAVFNAPIREGRFPKYGVPDRIVFVDSISKTNVGKVNRRIIREGFSPRHG